MIINKQSGANTSQVANAVKKELPKLRQYLPQDVNFALAMDQSKIIKSSTDSVSQSAIIGGLLAIFNLFVFKKLAADYRYCISYPFISNRHFYPSLFSRLYPKSNDFRRFGFRYRNVG